MQPELEKFTKLHQEYHQSKQEIVQYLINNSEFEVGLDKDFTTAKIQILSPIGCFLFKYDQNGAFLPKDQGFSDAEISIIRALEPFLDSLTGFGSMEQN